MQYLALLKIVKLYSPLQSLKAPLPKIDIKYETQQEAPQWKGIYKMVVDTLSKPRLDIELLPKTPTGFANLIPMTREERANVMKKILNHEITQEELKGRFLKYIDEIEKEEKERLVAQVAKGYAFADIDKELIHRVNTRIKLLNNPNEIKPPKTNKRWKFW